MEPSHDRTDQSFDENARSQLRNVVSRMPLRIAPDRRPPENLGLTPANLEALREHRNARLASTRPPMPVAGVEEMRGWGMFDHDYEVAISNFMSKVPSPIHDQDPAQTRLAQENEVMIELLEFSRGIAKARRTLTAEDETDNRKSLSVVPQPAPNPPTSTYVTHEPDPRCVFKSPELQARFDELFEDSAFRTRNGDLDFVKVAREIRKASIPTVAAPGSKATEAVGVTGNEHKLSLRDLMDEASLPPHHYQVSAHARLTQESQELMERLEILGDARFETLLDGLMRTRIADSVLGEVSRARLKALRERGAAGMTESCPSFNDWTSAMRELRHLDPESADTLKRLGGNEWYGPLSLFEDDRDDSGLRSSLGRKPNRDDQDDHPKPPIEDNSDDSESLFFPGLVPNREDEEYKTVKSGFSANTFYTASVGGIDMQPPVGRLQEYVLYPFRHLVRMHC